MQEHIIADAPGKKACPPQTEEGQARLPAFGPSGTHPTKCAPPMDSLGTGGGAPVLDSVTLLQPARAVSSLVRLQRRYGNRFVQRALALDRGETEARPEVLPPQACACGSHSASGGECEECRTKRAGVVHRTAAHEPAQRLSRQEDDGDSQPQSGTEGDGQNNFAQEDLGSDELPSETAGGRDACPVTAVFLSMVAGPQKANCRVDAGKFGAARLAEFRVIGAPSGGSVTVAEQFKAIDDPCGLFGLLQPNSFTTDSSGKFDDCYMLQSSQPLPAGCSLKVEQNHLLGGQVISKNQIIFGADSVSFCHFERLPGKCDFGARCKL